MPQPALSGASTVSSSYTAQARRQSRLSLEPMFDVDVGSFCDRCVRQSVRQVLKQVQPTQPDLGISRSAMDFVVSLMKWTMLSFASRVDMDFRCKTNVSACESESDESLLIGHLKHIMYGELLHYAEIESRKALKLVARFKKKDGQNYVYKGKYSTYNLWLPAACSAAEANLQFDPNVAILHCWCVDMLPIESSHFAVIIASVLHYVACEILELSKGFALTRLRRSSSKHMIEISDVKTVFRYDAELRGMFLLFNAAQGCVSSCRGGSVNFFEKIPELESSSSECSEGDGRDGYDGIDDATDTQFSSEFLAVYRSNEDLKKDNQQMRAQIEQMSSKLQILEQANADRDRAINFLRKKCSAEKEAKEHHLRRKETYKQKFIQTEIAAFDCFSELKELKKSHASLWTHYDERCGDVSTMFSLLQYQKERADKLEAEQAMKQLQQEQEHQTSLFYQRMQSDSDMRTKHVLIAVLDGVGEFLRPFIKDYFVSRHEEILKKPDLSWPDEINVLQRKGVACQTQGSLDIEKLSGPDGAWELARTVGVQETHFSKCDSFDSLDISAIMQLMLSCNGLLAPSNIKFVHQVRCLRNHLCHTASHQQLPCNILQIKMYIQRLCQKASARYKRNGSPTTRLKDALALLREIEHLKQPQHEDDDEEPHVCGVTPCFDSDSDGGSCCGSDCDNFD